MEPQNRHDAKAILKKDLASLHSDIQSATSVSTVKRALAEPLALFFDAPEAVDFLTNGVGTSLTTVLAASKYFSNIPIEAVDLYRDIFFRTCIAQHFEFLLRNVAVSWLPCFSEQEIKTLFESYFIPEALDSSEGTHHVPPPSLDLLGTLRFLSDAAAWTEHTHVVKVAVDLLQKLLTACRVEEFYVAEMTLQTGGMEAARIERWQQYVAIITFLPDKLANIFGVRPPEFFRTASFIRLIAAQIGSAVSSIASREPVDVPAIYLTELIEKLVRLGYAEHLMESWMPSVKESVCQPDVALLWNAIFQKLGRSESEHMLLQLLERLRKLLSIGVDLTTHREASKYMLTWIGSQTMERNPHIRDLLSRKFLYDSVLHVDILRILVRCMAEFPRSSALSVASNIRRLVETWTDKSFLRYASYEQHAHVTYLILLSLSYLTPEDASGADLLGIFLTGMTAYLDNSDPHIRKRGMVTAECLSKILNSSALDFGLEADEEVTFLRSLADPTTRDGPMGGMSTSSAEVFDVDLELPEKISDADHDEDDPDEVVLPSHNQEGDESSPDSDDDLPAYDLREPDVRDADAKILKPPMYIRECLDGLRAEDDPEQLNICLARASELIERAPQDDLDHIAYDLGSRLIHLHNNFDLTDFDKNRMRALVSLLVRMPHKISRYLIDQVYERQISIQQRLDILTCLALGATTLSGLQSIGAGEKSAQAPSQDMQVSASRGRPRPKPVSRSNMFGPVATSFLFPLLTKVHEMIERPNASGGPFGTLLLTKIIITAGVFVYCAQNTVDNRRLTRDYFNCLWALRYLPLNDTTGLLNAILVGFNVILEALPQSILLDEFGGPTNELGQLREWVSDVLVTDSRRENLQLAASILSSSRNLFDSQRELFWGDAL
ncbi:uncharacterized protein SPPG_00231 [Spizellomyces punctatus DAOM BR117]|uniref:Uncharacterized protein n=1 Tax=Spizellomyces punctatus (strain DAOM BR117) TaxID=645134 RepID=A0A0L0HUF7_SPIPD|nr:uncharacterized protein SPPG_00231 [Spizellomyces punctatus DAOM BR117]KND04504.1 hypothetical protein SPPG_00231 [Spizellomyces punctatus DAOM BR117]|eukprot:XP_016612543.1 hypothetical protein SPPG_00231 [Spizellomyces punctatus DAOM BR117]